MNSLASLIISARDDQATLLSLAEQAIEAHAREGQFFYELLQNAEDAGATQIRFAMYKDRLEVFHDGRPFTLSNLNALCDFARSDKIHNLNQIGQFGIGFKAVFRICNTFRLYSQPSHYRMTATDAQPAFGLSVVGFRTPEDVPFEEVEAPFTTRYVFPFACGEKLSAYTNIDDLRKSLKERLHKIGTSTLLFMKNLQSVEYCIVLDSTREEGKYFLKKERLSKICTLLTSNTEIKHQEKRKKAKNISAVSYLRFSKLIDNKSARTVDIAFCVKKSANGGFDCISNKSQKISVYFPTETDSKLNFIVQGPFRTDPSRSFVPDIDKDNIRLANLTAELLREALEELRDTNKLNISFISALPLDENNFKDNSLYKPLHEESWKLLVDENNPILPAQNGGYVSLNHAVHADNKEFMHLFDDNQLTEILSYRWDYRGIDYHWVSSELNKSKFRSLRDHLQSGDTKITKFNLQNFVEILHGDPDFIAQQSTEWLIQFYNYVSKYGSFECEQNYTANLLTIDFIRTNHGDFISPYIIRRGMYEPNIFLPIDDISSVDLACHDFDLVDNVLYGNCKYFFENVLHLNQPDEFEYRVSSIKTRYSKDYHFSEESHIDDVKFLLENEFRIKGRQDIKDIFLLRCSDGYMRSAKKEKIYVPKDGSINIEAYLRHVADDVHFVDIDLYSKHDIKIGSLDFLGVKASLITGESIHSGTYITDNPGPNPKWNAWGHFCWILNMEYIFHALYYIEKHPYDFNSRQKSKAIMETLSKYRDKLYGYVEISSRIYQSRYDYALIIKILRSDFENILKIARGLNLRDGIPDFRYKESKYLVRMKNASSYDFFDHFNWLYTESGEWASPRDITKSDLNVKLYGKPKEPELYEYLGFKKDHTDLIKELMIRSTEQERRAFFVSECKRTFGYQPDELRRVLTKNTRVQIDDGGEDEEFPCARVKNWHLLQKHVAEELVCASPVEYKYLVRHIRTSKDYAIVDEYLKNMYASRESKACACQMCHQFCGRRCSEQLFNHPEVELSSMNLNLCPKCAREYKTLRSDDRIMQRFRKNILDLSEEDIGSSDPVSISLQDHDIWFTQIHIAEIRESLRLQREKKENDEEMTSLD